MLNVELEGKSCQAWQEGNESLGTLRNGGERPLQD